MVNDFRPFGAAMAKLSTSSKTIERADGSEVELTTALDKKRRIDTAYEVSWSRSEATFEILFLWAYVIDRGDGASQQTPTNSFPAPSTDLTPRGTAVDPLRARFPSSVVSMMQQSNVPPPKSTTKTDNGCRDSGISLAMCR